MIYLGLGLLFLIALLGLKHWLAETDPKKLLKQLRFTGFLIGILLVVFLLITGRLAWVWAAFLTMIPWISRLSILRTVFGFFAQKKASQAQPTTTNDAMSRKKAAEILGVTEQASEKEIRAAHKELMKRNHPDQGGSPFLAQMLNQARDCLLDQ